MPVGCGADDVMYKVAKNKSGCVFGKALLVISISNEGAGAGPHLWNESGLCLPGASRSHGPFSTCRTAPWRIRVLGSATGGR